MHYQAEILADLLVAHGVTDIFVSPGSRNAPLIEAISTRSELKLHVTTPDERAAAFVALGYASCAMRPIALICTSGTAILNYAPAVAEAFYRQIPMIVISADRPHAWIGQDDSQTMVQSEVLYNIVKQSYDIGPCSLDRMESEWYADRVINDAIITALTGPTGPVHLNIHIGKPDGEKVFKRPNGVVKILRSRPDLEVSRSRELASMLKPPCKVLIVAASDSPSSRISKALGRLSEIPNVAVVAEPVANVNGRRIIKNPDAALAACRDNDALSRLVPDVVITIGGALVSARIKRFLRKNVISEHWQVGNRLMTSDCFTKLTMRVEMDPGYFLQQLSSAMQIYFGSNDSTYADDWELASRRGNAVVSLLASRSPWCDFKAMSVIIPNISRRWNVELSNGTAIRYACMLGMTNVHRCGCNRGVSGIDGSTSTAIGVSMAYGNDVTLLITGDMSAMYDIGALGVSSIPDRFKMVVIDNGGGGIFRSIPATRDLSVARSALSMDGIKLPLSNLAEGFGFEYFEVADEADLRGTWPLFCAGRRKSIMRIITSPDISARVYESLFENFNINLNNERVENHKGV